MLTKLNLIQYATDKENVIDSLRNTYIRMHTIYFFSVDASVVI